jgi:5-methylcytosine-specific restriction endonuclease McrA
MLCPQCNLEVSKIMLTKGVCEKCYKHDYYLVHKEKFIAKAKQWATDNPKRAREIWHKHSKKKNTGRPAGVPRYNGPCISCGNINPGGKSFVKKMCRACYKRMDWANKHPDKTHTVICIDCGTEIVIKKGKERSRCRKCGITWKRNNAPGFRERERVGLRKFAHSDKGKEGQRRHIWKRRALLAGTISTLTKQEWADILLKHNYSCAYCGSNEKIELDHVIPISKGGTHTHDNVLPACRKCNATKNDKPLDVFLAKSFTPPGQRTHLLEWQRH